LKHNSGVGWLLSGQNVTNRNASTQIGHQVEGSIAAPQAANITGIWEGTLDGTNWGRLLAKLLERNGVISGHAEISDVGNGAFSLEVSGRRNADGTTLYLSPGRYGVRSYPGTIDVHITSGTDTLVRGEWSSSIGTYGTFRATRQVESEESLEDAARRTVEADAAFIIMAYEDQSSGFLPVVDIHSAIKRGCEAAGVRAHRVDEVEHSGAITRLILDHIERHRFLISDLTHERPNVYYEIGYAHGLKKEVVLTAQKGTKLHFDISVYNVIFYSSGTELEGRLARRLRARIENLAELIG
jgi:hypothetical protein